MKRIVIKNSPAYYHCMSRAVNGERLFDDEAKEVWRRQLWKSALFHEVRIVNYCLMDNHFHVLVGIDPVAELSDRQWVAKLQAFYDHPKQAAQLRMYLAAIRAGGLVAKETKARLQARMGNMAAFMKSVKQRFSIWYNKRRGRFGTMWSDRYKSVLVEGTHEALAVVAAYIALNPVRTGQVKCPEEYRFSGYAEAAAGLMGGRQGIMEIFPGKERREAMRSFRLILYGMGARPKMDGGGQTIPTEEVAKILEAGGAVSLTEALRCRFRFITDGVILGTEGFVARTMAAAGHKKAPGKFPKPFAGVAEMASLTVPRSWRGRVFG